MRRLAIPAISIGVALLLVVVVVVGSASGATRSHSKLASLCHLPVHARQRLADEYAQVYEVRETEVYACAYGSRRIYRLTRPYICPSSACPEIPLAQLKLAGSFIAYEPQHPSTSTIIVRNLVTGRIFHDVPVATPANPDFSVGYIVLKRDGSVAWTATPNIVKARSQVHAFDKSGNRILAYINENENVFLALFSYPEPYGSQDVEPSVLYWTQEGKPMSAVLN
jgi:hypothetical protein